jgi:large subunit ribosomal protein L35
MPKLKTHKATTKRFYYTGQGKLMRKKAGQDHFNARESGVVTKRKRRHVSADSTTVRTIKMLTPYH